MVNLLYKLKTFLFTYIQITQFLEKYKILNYVAEGSQGIYYKVQKINNQQVYCAGFFKSKKAIQQRIQIHEKLNNLQGVIKIVEIYDFNDKDVQMNQNFQQFQTSIIYNYCKSSLTNFVNQYFIENYKPELQWIEFQLRQFQRLYKIVGEMHKLHIFHMDLKPDNLMFDDDNNLCIIDLGSAQYVLKNKDDCTIISPYFDQDARLVYPLQTTQKFSSTIVEQQDTMLVEGSSYDIYSLGCCLFYMLTGQYLHLSLQENREQYQLLIEQVGHQVADIVHCLTAQLACFRPKTYKILDRIDQIIKQIQNDEYINGFDDPQGLVRLSGFGQSLYCDIIDKSLNENQQIRLTRSVSQKNMKFIQDKTNWFDDQSMLFIQNQLRITHPSGKQFSMHQSEFNIIHQSIKLVGKKKTEQQQQIEQKIQKIYQKLIFYMGRQVQYDRQLYFSNNDSDTMDYIKVHVSNISTNQISSLIKTKEQKLVVKVGQQIMREQSVKDFYHKNVSDISSLESDKLITLSEYSDSLSFMKVNDCSVSYDSE